MRWMLFAAALLISFPALAQDGTAALGNGTGTYKAIVRGAWQAALQP
jgi:hypothetical protein